MQPSTWVLKKDGVGQQDGSVGKSASHTNLTTLIGAPNPTMEGERLSSDHHMCALAFMHTHTNNNK